jgi:hypothetical protein
VTWNSSSSQMIRRGRVFEENLTYRKKTYFKGTAGAPSTLVGWSHGQSEWPSGQTDGELRVN